MSIDYPFSDTRPVVPSQIETGMISLDEWIIIQITGADAKSYLQGQLTYNLNELEEGKIVYCAHCDPKGRMWGNLILFLWKKNYYYLIRKNISQQQLIELKKYAVFSKVTFHELTTPYYLLGFFGKNITQYLKSHYGDIPTTQQNVIEVNAEELLLYFEVDSRYLLISTTLPDIKPNSLPLFSSKQWELCDMLSGWAVININMQQQLLPQAINLDALQGVSFNKGCYIGQEMITRATFRGANKRAMFLLSGSSLTEPILGQQIEIKLAENSWKKTGVTLNSLRTQDNTLWLQLILNKDTPPMSHFRVSDKESDSLHIHPLPYSQTTSE